MPLHAVLRAGRIALALVVGAGLASAGATQNAPAGASAAAPRVTSWQHDGSDIPADPAWRTGTLANGVRFAVRRNALPPGSFSIRVRMDVGGFMEKDAEQGWSHLLEHMVFRGTPTMADGEGIRTWERLGASFGTDTNAETTLKSTTYRLDIPRNDPATIDQVTGILADMMRNATIDPKLLEIERKVVLAELGLRLTPLAREARKTFSPLFVPGLLAEKRDIAGSEETLNGATADALRAYYHKWYRPDRAVVVMSGDADPAVMEAAIRKAFGDWKAPGKPPAAPDYGSLVMPAVPAAVLRFPLAANDIDLSWERPADESPWTVARVQQAMIDQVAIAIVSRRLGALARTEDSLVTAGATTQNSLHTYDGAMVRARYKAGAWRQALSAVFGVVNGTLAAPPSKGEIDEQVARLSEAYARRVIDQATLTSTALVADYVGDVDDHDVSPVPEFYRDTFKALRPAITPDTVERALHRLFAPDVRFGLSMPGSEQPVDTATAAAALTESKTAAGGKVADIRTISLAELKLDGAPARVVSSDQIGGLGVDRVRLSNGVTILMKKTAFEKGAIELRVRVGHGRLSGPADVAPLDWSYPAMIAGGIGPFSVDELLRFASGRQVNFSFAAAPNEVALSGRTNADDLSDMLMLMSGAITQPRFEGPAIERARTQLSAAVRSIRLQPSSALSAGMADRLYGGDKRFHGAPDLGAIRALTVDALKDYWTRELGEGPITVEAVGDFDRDALIAAVTKSLGRLPARPDHPLTPADVATQPSKPGRPIVIFHAGAADQAVYASFWPTVGRYADIQEARALRLAAEIVKTRLTEQFRGQSGGTYSPFAVSDQSDLLPAFGMFVVGAQVQKDRIEEFRTKLLAVVADLTATEVGADELDRAKTPVLSLLARGQASSNAFWMGTIDAWVDDPRYVDTFTTLDSGYKAVTPADIRRVVTKYLKPGGAIEARVLPIPSLPSETKPSAAPAPTAPVPTEKK